VCHSVVADMLAAMKGDVMASLPNAGYEGRVTCSPWRDDEERGTCPGLGQGVHGSVVEGQGDRDQRSVCITLVFALAWPGCGVGASFAFRPAAERDV
jgi:hypothetical protein